MHVRAQGAVIAMFAANAALYASFATRIPAIRDQTGASTTELGIALLVLAIGSIAAMTLSGRLISRYGSAPVLLGSVLVSAAAFPIVGVLESPVTLALGLALLGAGYGPWDVAMNVQAHRVETVLARPLMSRFHGCWSLGALGGAGVGALLAGAGVAVRWHLTGAAGLALLAALVSLRYFIPDRPAAALTPPAVPGRAPAGPPAPPTLPGSAPAGPPAPPTLLGSAPAGPGIASESRPGPVTAPAVPAGPLGGPVRRRLMALGLLTLCATLVEGAAADWLPLYLTDERAAGPGLAASGYVVFALSMAFGRLAGTPIIERLGRVRALRLAGGLAGLGVLATITLPGVGGAMVGVVGWGLGVALVFPTAMSAAADGSPRPAEAIAQVATIGYAGFLAGPPLIGLFGDIAGLGWGLVTCLPLAAGMIALAGRADPVVHPPTPP